MSLSQQVFMCTPCPVALFQVFCLYPSEGFHCDIFTHAYDILWSSSVSLLFIPLNFSHPAAPRVSTKALAFPETPLEMETSGALPQSFQSTKSGGGAPHSHCMAGEGALADVDLCVSWLLTSVVSWAPSGWRPVG
jgi:hypothetical protein